MRQNFLFIYFHVCATETKRLPGLPETRWCHTNCIVVPWTILAGSVTLVLCWCSIEEPGINKSSSLNFIQKLFTLGWIHHNYQFRVTAGCCHRTFRHCGSHGVRRPAVPAADLIKTAFCTKTPKTKAMSLIRKKNSKQHGSNSGGRKEPDTNMRGSGVWRWPEGSWLSCLLFGPAQYHVPGAGPVHPVSSVAAAVSCLKLAVEFWTRHRSLRCATEPFSRYKPCLHGSETFFLWTWIVQGVPHGSEGPRILILMRLQIKHVLIDALTENK